MHFFFFHFRLWAKGRVLQCEARGVYTRLKKAAPSAMINIVATLINTQRIYLVKDI